MPGQTHAICGLCLSKVPEDLFPAHLSEHGLGSNVELAEAIHDATEALKEEEDG